MNKKKRRSLIANIAGSLQSLPESFGQLNKDVSENMPPELPDQHVKMNCTHIHTHTTQAQWSDEFGKHCSKKIKQVSLLQDV